MPPHHDVAGVCGRQITPWCSLIVESGASGTDDRRPELQRLLDMATAGDAPFNVIVVHSLSRFARDHFALEYHVRRLRKAGVRLVSITQNSAMTRRHNGAPGVRAV